MPGESDFPAPSSVPAGDGSTDEPQASRILAVVALNQPADGPSLDGVAERYHAEVLARGMLFSFATVSQGARFAIEAMETATQNQGVSFGLHVGESGGEAHPDELASALAESGLPGEIRLSQPAHDLLREATSDPQLRGRALGPQSFPGIDGSLNVFQLRRSGEAEKQAAVTSQMDAFLIAARQEETARRERQRKAVRTFTTVLALCFLILAIALIGLSAGPRSTIGLIFSRLFNPGAIQEQENQDGTKESDETPKPPPPRATEPVITLPEGELTSRVLTAYFSDLLQPKRRDSYSEPQAQASFCQALFLARQMRLQEMALRDGISPAITWGSPADSLVLARLNDEVLRVSEMGLFSDPANVNALREGRPPTGYRVATILPYHPDYRGYLRHLANLFILPIDEPLSVEPVANGSAEADHLEKLRAAGGPSAP